MTRDRSDMDNFCIKASYQARGQARIFVGNIARYWNAPRRASANLYQWDVYVAARDLLRNLDRPDCTDVGCGYSAKVHRLDEFRSLPEHFGFTVLEQRVLPQKRHSLLLTRFQPMLSRLRPSTCAGCQLPIRQVR